MTDLTVLSAPLLRATARARSLKASTLVVKLGGSAMEDPASTAGTLDSIAALHQMGLRLILVHGGGKPIDRAMADAGLEVKKVLGRRYTDDATLKLVVKVLCDEINAGLIAEFSNRGVVALPMHSPPLQAVFGERLMLPALDLQPVDLGHVGKPTLIHQSLIRDFLAAGVLPVIPSLAWNDAGGWLNVNADTVASAVAGAMKAEAVYFLTDTPGVLANRADASSLYARLTVAECKALIATGVIDGGMIPKVEACFEALEAGAKRAVILDGRNPHSLLSEFVSETALGTEILP